MTQKKDFHPKAPKDPIKKRSFLYVMADTIVEATPRGEGKPSQELYMDNKRLKSKVKLASSYDEEDILQYLDTTEGFRKLVHSIGVTVKSDVNPEGSINFVLHNWGKVNIFESGSKISKTCPLDGSETIIKLEEYEWSPEDNVVGKFGFEFDQIGDMANATIKLYLMDGFEVPEISLEPPVDFDSSMYQSMIAKSLLHKGNNQRLKAAIDKAQKGEEVTIAYIGGSITQGAGAKPINTGCYAYKSYMKFKDLFSKEDGANVHFIKAGVGGTPSELGMIRYDRDILRDGSVEPDIVIIEFAVNDAGDETMGACFESLALKILSSENKPAVILLFSVFVDDYNLQERLAPIGLHYNLPMVSVKDALVDQFKLSKEEGNVISKRQYFYDVYHPTNDGHTVMADSISYLLSEVAKDTMDSEDINLDKQPVVGNRFTKVHLLDRKDNIEVAIIQEGSFKEMDTELQMVEMDDNQMPTPQFPHNWMHTALSGNDSFKMRITSKNLLIVFKDSGNTDFGKAQVYVDGVLFKTLDPHENNWTHCNPVILYQEDTSQEHEIEIKMVEGEEDKSFTILGFGYTL